MSKYYDGVEFPFCDEFSKYEKMAKIGQGTFGCVFCHKEYKLIPPCRSYLLLYCYVLAWLTLAGWHPWLHVRNETTLTAMVVLKQLLTQVWLHLSVVLSYVFNREVFKAKHRQTGKKVALKKVLMENEKEGVRSCFVSSHFLLDNLKSCAIFQCRRIKSKIQSYIYFFIWSRCLKVTFFSFGFVLHKSNVWQNVKFLGSSTLFLSSDLTLSSGCSVSVPNHSSKGDQDPAAAQAWECC